MSEFYRYEGRIQFGDRVGDEWFGFTDINHPYLQDMIAEILESKELFKGYNLWVVGGIIEGWMTWDMDWVVSGPYDPIKVQELLLFLTDIGFKYKVYPDAIYTFEVYNINDYDYQSSSRWNYRCSNICIQNGEKKDWSNHIKVDDNLYKWWQTFPYPKQHAKLLEGHVYQDPLKLI